MAIEMNKGGQITIYVIIAMLIVAAIALVFVVVRGPSMPAGEEFDPKVSVESCTREAVNEAVEIMLPQGGFIEPTNYKLYNNIKVSYLCLNVGFYKSCINQHPMLLNEMKEEIRKFVFPKVEQCFSELKRTLEKNKNEVSMGNMIINIDFSPERVFANISRELKITKSGQTRKFNNYKVDVINPIYDLGIVAIEIASQEAKFCYFEYVGYSLLYSRFDIKKFAMSDSTRIYTIKDKISEKVMNIAIRGCAIPGGI